MPSIVTVNYQDKILGEICSLDDRYGQARTSLRRKDADEMARLDDLIEAAGVVPGDRIEVRVSIWVRNEDQRRMEQKEFWLKIPEISPDAVFLAIDNGRFRVRGAPGTKYENERWALFDDLRFMGTECVLEVRKETPAE